MPSERTLRDYAHCIRDGVGFIPEVDAQLVKEANMVAEKDKFVVLSWDEMKIKEGLVFDKQNCNLIGFTNVGDVNDVFWTSWSSRLTDRTLMLALIYVVDWEKGSLGKIGQFLGLNSEALTMFKVCFYEILAL